MGVCEQGRKIIRSLFLEPGWAKEWMGLGTGDPRRGAGLASGWDKRGLIGL